MSGYTDGEWTNEVYEISWLDHDTVRIVNRKVANQYALIDGGDFESILSGLCAAFQYGRWCKGKADARTEAKP